MVLAMTSIFNLWVTRRSEPAESIALPDQAARQGLAENLK